MDGNGPTHVNHLEAPEKWVRLYAKYYDKNLENDKDRAFCREWATFHYNRYINKKDTPLPSFMR